MRVTPEVLRPGHPAEGKHPTKGNAALFLCDATRCLPEIGSATVVEEALRATRRGLL
jgi:hypothetical protein